MPEGALTISILTRRLRASCHFDTHCTFVYLEKKNCLVFLALYEYLTGGGIAPRCGYGRLRLDSDAGKGYYLKERIWTGTFYSK